MNLLLHVAIIFYLANKVYMGGSPVLIKMDGKKGGKKGGNLILISGGKCGSPTLIKGGGGKKGGGEMILVGGQSGNCEHEKTKVHVVKQFVPVPYYVPKPIYKYIMRHHYVPVRQVVVKPVPVPYPVKTYKKYDYGYNSPSSSSSSGGYSMGGYGGGSADSYNSEGYDSHGATANNKYYSGASSYGKYSTGVGYSDDSSGSVGDGGSAGSGSGMASSYKRQSYDSPVYSTSASPMALTSGSGYSSPSPSGSSSSSLSGVSLNTAASENFYYEAKKPFGNSLSSYGDYQSSQSMNSGSAVSTGADGSNDYRILTPVYSAPNGELYAGQQQFLQSNSSATVLPSYMPKSAYSSMMLTPDAGTYGARASALPQAASSMTMSAKISTRSGKKSSPYLNKKSYKTEIERAKKLINDQFGKRMDQADDEASTGNNQFGGNSVQATTDSSKH